MEAKSSTYTYTPLDSTKRQIRLIHLLPKRPKAEGFLSETEAEHVYVQGDVQSNNDESIHCTFSLASLEAFPTFDALSYVWGNSKDVTPVHLEGHVFPVTRNLHSALQNLRKDDEERVLWVDALCINQGDPNERSNQVAEMHFIFERAETVVAFLGEMSEGRAIAMDFIEMTAEPGIHLDPFLEPHIVVRGMDANSETLQDYLIEFFTLPWWKRVWTVQEYVLASQPVFQCGKRLLKASFLSAFMTSVTTHGNTCCRKWKHLNAARPGALSITTAPLWSWTLISARRAGNFRAFLMLLASLRSRESTDPRDKVYGMLGLARGSYRERINPNYNCSPKEVYVNLVHVATTEERNLDILSHACGKREEDMGLPSFVPDWSIPLSGNISARAQMLAIEPNFNACSGSLAELRIISPDQAVTRAVLTDTILEISPTSFESKEDISHYRKLARLDDRTMFPYSGRATAFWQTLCGGLVFSSPRWRRVEETDFPTYQNWLVSSDSQLAPPQLTDRNGFDIGVQVASCWRRFAVTEKGYLGWVPSTSKKGDTVSILPGGRIPYVLRLIENGDGRSDTKEVTNGSRYEFLGDAYIHGLMYGEGYDIDQLKPITLI